MSKLQISNKQLKEYGFTLFDLIVALNICDKDWVALDYVNKPLFDAVCEIVGLDNVPLLSTRELAETIISLEEFTDKVNGLFAFSYELNKEYTDLTYSLSVLGNEVELYYDKECVADAYNHVITLLSNGVSNISCTIEWRNSVDSGYDEGFVFLKGNLKFLES